MSDEKERLPFPSSPYRTVVSSNGIVATVEVGSYADYLDRMEKWLLQERDNATDAAERALAETALRSIRKRRKDYLDKEQSSQPASNL